MKPSPSRNKKQDALCATRNKQLDRYKIPKKVIDAVETELLENHRIYYKKQGRYITVRCSVDLREEKYLRKGQDMSYEECAVKTFDVDHKESVTCPICNRTGVGVSIGRSKQECISKYLTVYKAVNYNLLAKRYIEAYMVMGFDRELTIDFTEYARTFYDRCEERVYEDYYKRDLYVGRSFWDYKNLQGLSNIQKVVGREFNESECEKTFLKKNRDAMRSYTEYPEIEYLEDKAPRLQQELQYRYHAIVCKVGEKNPWKRYNILERDWQYLVTHNCGVDFINTCRALKSKRIEYKPVEADYIANNNIEIKTIVMISKFMSITKFQNYIRKQFIVDHPDRTGTTRTIVQYYKDYLSMAEEVELDLTDSIYLFPKSLTEKHNELSERIKREQDEKAQLEAENSYPNIKKNYRRLNRKLSFKIQGFILRPARSATEIIVEGRTLHHCVGSSTYLSKHNTGKSYIVFLRKSTSEEEPWCTIELDPEKLKILQWYEAYDKKPNKDIIEPIIESYLEFLETHKKEKEKNDGYTTNIQLSAV